MASSSSFGARASRPRVLVVAHDVVGERMAGPGIRALELSRALSATAEVVLACPGSPPLGSTHPRLPSPAPPSPTLKDSPVVLLGYDASDPRDLAAAADASDVVVASGHVVRAFPFLSDPARPLVIDLYDPSVLESLELHAGKPLDAQELEHEHGMRLLLELLRVGDYFLCASERQRDFWLGMLTAVGRVSPALYAQDKTVGGLVGVVPFGLASRPPRHLRPVLKGVVPGIAPADRVLLWAGGLWEWLDPLTPIRAMRRVSAVRADVRLFFMSTTHPNPRTAAQMSMPRRAEGLARELDLLGRHVFFSDDWIPYAERESYLLEADLGLSSHPDHLETRYSFRTRILDYVWAGLPIVCTEGDSLGEVVAARGLGAAVRAGDADGLAAAILRLLAEPDAKGARRDAFGALARELSWERAARPLVELCARPRKAAPSAGSSCAGAPDDLAGRLAAAERELRECREVVRAFQRGRFMRLMAMLAALRSKIGR